jgi:hypothetical protein
MQFNNYSSSNYNQYQHNPSLYNTSNANYNNYNKVNHDYIMKQDIYDSIVKYYGDIVMTKLNSRSTSDGATYGLYYCRVGCMLCIDNRYILVIVRENTNNGAEIPVGTQIYLSNLQWISFQTRSIDDFETVNPHDIKMKQQNVTNNRNTIIDMEMRLSEELNDRIRYDCSEHYPVTVDIMKKKAKEKNIYDMMDGYEKEYYTPTCSLQTLLESYQCVLTLNV